MERDAYGQTQKDLVYKRMRERAKKYYIYFLNFSGTPPLFNNNTVGR